MSRNILFCTESQHTHPSSTLPTPCITNTVLIPLPTWLYLLTLGAILLVRLQRPAPAPTAPNSTGAPKAPKDDARSRSHRTWPQCTLSGLYYILLAATLGMISLEIARLADSGQGFGLLPFTLAGTVVAGGMRYWSHRHRGTWAALRASPSLDAAAAWARVGWWGGVAVMYAVGTAVAVGGLRRGDPGFERGFGDLPYPLADQVTDRAVVVGVAVVQAGLEGWRLVTG